MASFVHLLDQRRLIGPGGSTVSGSLAFYYTGTSVLAPIYQDSDLTIPSANPVAVAAGASIPTIFLDESIIYRRVITYSDGTYDETDPLGALFSEGEFGLPVGAIIDYSGPTAPEGFLFCGGQAVSRSVYSELFAAIGTTYGPGNGSSTFNVPDARGRVLAGKDNMAGSPSGRLSTEVDGVTLGAAGGAESHTLTTNEMPGHSHPITDPGHNHTFANFQLAAGSALQNGSGATETATRTTSTSFTGITIGSTGGDEAHNNVQPTIVVNKIIKATSTTFLSLIGILPDFNNKANASALGIAPTATNMGSYTGNVLADNNPAKANIQELSDAIEDLPLIPSILQYDPVSSADTSGKTVYIPDGVTTTSIASAALLQGRYWGGGQIRTADNNQRAKWFSQISSRPAVGNHDSIETAFNGDISKSHFQIEFRITGNTLGTPTTGYLYTPEASPNYTMLYVSPEAGHNQSLTGNGGRTGATAYRADVKHYGNGDAVAFNFAGIVAGQKAGATHFLAQPAIVGINGNLDAAANGVYLNPREISMKDNGYDVACVGDVSNLNRTNGTGAMSCWWGHYRGQSTGTTAVDNVLSVVGPHKVGIDFALDTTDFGANQAAISLKAGQTIYLNNFSSNGEYSNGFNGDWIRYILGVGTVIASNGNPTLQVGNDRVNLTQPLITPTTTVAALPAAILANRGMELCVTDATSTTRYSTVTGGGSNFVKVLCNGSVWLIQ